jgi:FlaA1/EpsC-like NDP-sugar epimerase
MSIPEAASLVIQAGAMAKGGELYVLEMGDPIKIDDIARSMIRLSGRTVQDDNNPNGDVTITYIGLRPGEKLREELLIANSVEGTEHPRIMKCYEPSLPLVELEGVLVRIRLAMAQRDEAELRRLLAQTIESFAGNENELAIATADDFAAAPSRAIH